MSEQQEVPTIHFKLESTPHHIGDKLPQTDLISELDTNSLFNGPDGLNRQVENFKKEYPDKQDMKLFYFSRMTEDEVANMKNSKREHVDSETLREMLNNYRANKAKEALNG